MEISMKRISGTLPVVLTIAACVVSTTALADDPLGFYVGAGLGYSTVRSDDPAYGLPGYYNDHETAWKVITGIRPISIVGAELEYIDFGHPSNPYDPNNSASNGFDSHPRAGVLFGLGYLPLPIPFFDIYGKAGVARLQTDVTTTTSNCPPGVNCSAQPTYIRHNETESKFAYGVGIQSRAWGFGFRAEYERISSQFGDPDALTVSATWTF
jgi:hypothetical protein